MSRQANGGKLVALNLVLLWILLLGALLLQWGIIRTLRRHDERFAQLDFPPPRGLEPGSGAPGCTVFDTAGDPVVRDDVVALPSYHIVPDTGTVEALHVAVEAPPTAG